MANVTSLWTRLDALEQENRFSGNPYPRGLARFPFRLSGQGFFPGGDGLWRENVGEPSDGNLPVGGVAFVGSDFGSLASYHKLLKSGYENVPTWRHLKKRILDAGVPTGQVFCTNAYLGLRTSSNALEANPAISSDDFGSFCAEFLSFQIEALQPKVLVLMGPKPQMFFQKFEDTLLSSRKQIIVLCTTHPYGDFNLARPRRDSLVAELRQAWESA